MNVLKHPVTLLFIGSLIGYSLSRVYDNVPIINKIPKIRVG